MTTATTTMNEPRHRRINTVKVTKQMREKIKMATTKGGDDINYIIFCDFLVFLTKKIENLTL